MFAAISSIAILLAAQDPRPADPATAPAGSQSGVAIVLHGPDDESFTITRDEVADWLLRYRGEYFAPGFARDRRLEREARAAYVEVTAAEVDQVIQAEVRERVQGAFAGKRELWVKELADAGRSEYGYLASRRMEVRTDLLARRLAEALSAGAGKPGAPPAQDANSLLGRFEREAKIEFSDEMWSAVPLPADTVVVRIDGQPVTRGEFAGYLLRLRGESQAPSFAEYWLVADAARKAGLTVSEEELVARIREDIDFKVRDLYEGRRDKWLTELAHQGRSEESYWREERIRATNDILAEKLLARTRQVTEADLRAAWEARYGKDGHQRDVRVLLMRIPSPLNEGGLSREEWEKRMREKTDETIRHMQELRTRALAGEDFGDLASKESQDPETRATGGRFPGGFRAERYPAAISEAIAALAPGEITAPLELRGNTIVMFQLVSEKVVPFEEARPALEKALAAQRPPLAERAGFVNQLATRYRIEVLPALYR